MLVIESEVSSVRGKSTGDSVSSPTSTVANDDDECAIENQKIHEESQNNRSNTSVKRFTAEIARGITSLDVFDDDKNASGKEKNNNVAQSSGIETDGASVLPLATACDDMNRLDEMKTDRTGLLTARVAYDDNKVAGDKSNKIDDSDGIKIPDERSTVDCESVSTSIIGRDDNESTRHYQKKFNDSDEKGGIEIRDGDSMIDHAGALASTTPYDGEEDVKVNERDTDRCTQDALNDGVRTPNDCSMAKEASSGNIYHKKLEQSAGLPLIAESENPESETESPSERKRRSARVSSLKRSGCCGVCWG